MNDREVEATVQVGAAVTCYRRAGHGPAVLLIAAADSAVARLFAPLAQRHRVVHPALPTPWSDAWLPGLVEALGLDRPTLVADARFGATLRPSLDAWPGYFGPLVLIGAPAVDATLDGGGLDAIDEIPARLRNSS